MTKDNVPMDGKTAATATVKVTDMAGNPLSGQTVYISASSSSKLNYYDTVGYPNSVLTDENGLAIVKVIKGVNANEVNPSTGGTVEVTASVQSSNPSLDPLKKTVQLNFINKPVEFSGQPMVFNSESLEVKKNTSVPGYACQTPCEITYSVKLTDVYGNPLMNAPIVSGINWPPTELKSGADGMVSSNITIPYEDIYFITEFTRQFLFHHSSNVMNAGKAYTVKGLNKK